MSREHRKYIRQEKTWRDKQQLQLDTLKPHNCSDTENLNFNVEQTVICPFCLYSSKLKNFLFSAKHGFHRGLGLCLKCKQKSTWRTLLAIPKMSAKQFAKFVFDYQPYFWEKCKYDDFKFRLKLDRDFANEFWNEYYRLKGDKYSNDDNY